MATYNQSPDEKLNAVITLDGTTGVKGPTQIACFKEKTVRVETTGVGGSNVVTAEGKQRSSPNWFTISTVTSATNATIDVSYYDYVRFNVTVANGSGVLYASGFFV